MKDVIILGKGADKIIWINWPEELKKDLEKNEIMKPPIKFYKKKKKKK